MDKKKINDEVLSYIKEWKSHRWIRDVLWISLGLISKIRNWEFNTLPKKSETVEEKITTKEEDGIHEVKYEWWEIKTKEEFFKIVNFNPEENEILSYQCNLRPVVIRVSAKETKLVNKYEHFLRSKPASQFNIDKVIDKIENRLKDINKKLPISEIKWWTKALQINIFDAHVNKKSFNDTEWNCNKAHESYISIINDMILDAPSDVEKVLLVIWQDFLNTDWHQKTSWLTPQDNIENEEESFEAWLNILIDAIEIVWQLWCPIEIISMPWNHARVLEQAMWTAINAIYKNNKHITVDYKPAYRKYWTFWNSAICICHWDWIKVNDMPMLFANERPDLWGTYKFKEVHHWHIHTQMVTEIKWLIVRSFASITTTDRRHSLNWYVWNIRWAHMIVWDKERGNKAQFNYYI